MKTRTRLTTKFNSSLLFGVLAVFLQSCTTNRNYETSFVGKKPITAAWTKIVRGANACPLSAKSVADGNNPKVGPNEPLTDLSVNASDDRRVTYKVLDAGLPNAYYGVTTLGDLRKANKFVLLVRDPLPGNPYHCLLSVITAKEFVSKTNCK